MEEGLDQIVSCLFTSAGTWIASFATRWDPYRDPGGAVEVPAGRAEVRTPEAPCSCSGVLSSLE